MTLTLVRFLHPGWTDGFLLMDGQWFGHTLERPKFMNGEENLKGLCCIPKGEYKVEVTPSALFKRDLPLILDVPGRNGIRFHGGNIAEDSRGCVLVGSNRISTGKIQGSLEVVLTQKIKAAGGAVLKILEAT
jgi:hypothetical protein